MRIYILLFIFLELIVSVQANDLSNSSPNLLFEGLIIRSRQMGLASSKQWLKLGHYQKTIWGGFESEVWGNEFFLSDHGKKDPTAELEATIQAFFKTEQTDAENKHPLCRFPARLLWLKDQLSIPQDKLPKAYCPLYDIYLKKLSQQSVSLVFSSYFMNSPASTFGHTFLRINQKDKNLISQSHILNEDRNELLDHGIGYAANVTTDNPLLYAIFGLFGLFPGTYTNVPYYYKVREYNDFESRDLWSYELNLSESELTLLVLHLWELGGTSFRYYFLTKNCSYQILTALEAAAPRLQLTDNLPFYVIPSSTLRVITSLPGLVKKISYRPSVRVQFFHRFEHLSQEEKTAFKKVVNGEAFSTETEILSSESQTHVLDTALDYWDFKYPGNITQENDQDAKFKQKLLVQRAAIPIRSEALKITPSPNEQPHLGHGSRRLSLENGFEKDLGIFTSLQMRFSLHSFLDAPEGYPPNALIEFFQFKFRYQWDLKKLQIDEIGLLRLMSLSPLREFQHSMSWRADLSLKKVLDKNCDHCLMLGVEGGPGLTVQPFQNFNFLMFAFLDAETGYSPSFLTSKFRLGTGPAIGILTSPVSFIRFLSEVGYRYEFFSAFPSAYHWNNELSLQITPHFATNLKVDLNPSSSQFSLKLQYYF